VHGVSEHLSRHARLGHAALGDGLVQGLHQDAAAGGVLQPVEELARDAEARGHHAAGVAGVDALADDLDREVHDEVPAQGTGEPELVVVACARVQADHELGRANARGEVLHIGGQVEGAALLAGLDQHHAARVRNALGLEGLDGAEGGEGRVAVVRAAATVELALLDVRHPGSEALAPALHLRLLVEVTVQQHRAGCRAGDLHQDHGRTAIELDHLDREALDGALAAPVRDQVHRLLHVPMRGPVRVEVRRLVRDADVVDQGRDDAVLEGARHMGAQELGVEVGGGFGGGRRRHGCSCGASMVA
jgi:hypothetical protein